MLLLNQREDKFDKIFYSTFLDTFFCHVFFSFFLPSCNYTSSCCLRSPSEIRIHSIYYYYTHKKGENRNEGRWTNHTRRETTFFPPPLASGYLCTCRRNVSAGSEGGRKDSLWGLVSYTLPTYCLPHLQPFFSSTLQCNLSQCSAYWQYSVLGEALYHYVIFFC